ncbi:Bax inhibitor-1/YccA family protein [Oceanobacillus massiliensis]|uniref:Bax inhibitor-1/YccA family protein n=1 Tax=Oceanobacillus massiliensis TaxID=1465765 RepID=UPI0002891E12|nr:Bax inhibitor-1/YccA family protein [Oceanobacillus massiliensis]
MNKRELLNKLLRIFVLTLAVACAGIYFGQFVPQSFMLPLMILEVVMLITAAILRRRRKIGYSFLFLFVAVSGLTMYPAIYYYLSEVGAEIVLLAFILALIIFVLLGIFGWIIKKDLSFIGSILFIILIGLIAFSLFNFFVPQSDTTILLVTIISAVLFSVYIVYDFNQIKHRHLSEKDIPRLALNLYLDFINLFMDLLRILSHFSQRRN